MGYGTFPVFELRFDTTKIVMGYGVVGVGFQDRLKGRDGLIGFALLSQNSALVVGSVRVGGIHGENGFELL